MIEGITKKKDKMEKKDKKSRRSSIESKVRKLFGRRGKYQTLTQAPTDDTGADSVDPEESTTCEPVSISDETRYSLSTILGTTIGYSANDSDISFLDSSVGGVSSHDDMMARISVVQGFFSDEEESQSSEQFFEPVLASDLPSSPNGLSTSGTSGELSVECFDDDGCNSEPIGEVVAEPGFEASFKENFDVEVDKSAITIDQYTMDVPLLVDMPSPTHEFLATGCDTPSVQTFNIDCASLVQFDSDTDNFESVATPDSSCSSRSLLVVTSPSPLSDEPSVAVVVATPQALMSNCETSLDKSSDFFDESDNLFEARNVSLDDSAMVYPDIENCISAAEISFEAEILEELHVLTSNLSAQTVAHSADDLFTPLSQLQVYFKSAIILDETPAGATTNSMERSLAIKKVKQYRVGGTTVCVLALIGMYIAVFFVETWGSIHDRVQQDFYTKLLSLGFRSKNQKVDSSLAPISVHALMASNDFLPIEFPESIKMSMQKQVEDTTTPEKVVEAKSPQETLSYEDIILMFL
jgi:hypothetical protein